MKLSIHTLGNFDIEFDGQSILEISNRSYKIYRLLQYFITYRGRLLLPETIIDNLYDDIETGDPKNVLRTQIFRLRQVLKTLLISCKADISEYFNISVLNGYYCFELGESSELDLEVFEKNINEGDKIRSYDTKGSLEFYKKSIEIYKGHYLSINAHENWLVPTRNRLRRLYINTFFKIIEILECMNDNYGIIELCEEVLSIESYEESIHICLIDAMLNLGQIKNAMSHYNYLTSLLSKDMGVRPSSALKSVYRKIESYYETKEDLSIDDIKLRIDGNSVKEVLLCDNECFRFLCNNEKRKGTNCEKPIYIGVITLDKNRNTTFAEQNKMFNYMSTLLEKILNKGDIYSYWNESQILVLFNEAKDGELIKIKKRIKDDFCKATKLDKQQITMDFKPLVTDIKKDLLCKAY